MANASFKETITVTSVGPYGVKVGNEYYRFGKNLNKDLFTEGHTYAIEYGIGKAKDGSPAKYMNAVLSDNGGAPALNPTINQAPVPQAVDNRPRRAGFDKPLTEYDLRLQAQISLAGVLQASMQAISTQVSGVDNLIKESQRVAKTQVEFIKEEVDALFAGK